MKDNGWVKLHRKFLDWEWFQDSKMVHLFLHLLLIANHDEGKWKGKTVARGQLITGLFSLSKRTGISYQSLRTCLERLKSTGEITSETTNKFRIITIVNYDSYQQDDKKSTSKLTYNLTNNQQTTNNQSTTNKNNIRDKNYNTNDKILDNKIPFINFWSIYPNKGDKVKTERSWNSLTREVQMTILEDLPKRIKGEKWAKDDGRYIEMSTTYLNGERWSDDIKVYEKVEERMGSIDLTKK